jgi:hypothetical protein
MFMMNGMIDAGEKLFVFFIIEAILYMIGFLMEGIGKRFKNKTTLYIGWIIIAIATCGMLGIIAGVSK